MGCRLVYCAEVNWNVKKLVILLIGKVLIRLSSDSDEWVKYRLYKIIKLAREAKIQKNT